MALPYPTPRFGEPLRLAFVGQQTFFEVCSLAERSRRVTTMFHDFRQGADADAMRAALDAFAPHAVVVWRPEIVPAGALDGLRATVIGFLTEPIPRTPGRRAHPDLRRRRADLRAADAGAFDRIVAFDPLIVPVAEQHLPVWRAVPIPVADRLYATVTRHPDAYHRVRVRGRMKAEQYRASRVWPHLVADCFADLAAFGTTRRGAS